MVLDAGFGAVESHLLYRLDTADGPGPWRVVLKATP
jgi:hypothetical protein